MIFKNAWILIFIPICLGPILWVYRQKRRPTFRFPSTSFFSSTGGTFKTQFSGLPFFLRLLAVVLFVVALAGPRSVLEETVIKAEGIDIVLVVDSSGSMAAEDFEIDGQRVNRLEVVKEVVEDFVSGREYDRIGFITFAKFAYTVCPLTTDYPWLITNLKRIQLGLVQDGTAIGSAINSALVRLQKSSAKSKVVILLTDGINNAGKTDPIVAAKTALAMGVKIYAIGAGRMGYAPFPVQDFFGRSYYQNVEVNIDEATLKEIAKITGGKYYRATNTNSLKKIYEQIDSLEKTEIEELGFREYKELFGWFLLTALILLGVEIVLSNTIFLRIP